jgi:amino acid adenylation domain-containing protein
MKPGPTPPDVTGAWSGGVHVCVAAGAAHAADAVAIVAGDQHLTYGALLLAAGRLAARLQRAGAGPETRVALLVDRSVDLGIALLGTLAAGAAYVPLDPQDTPERHVALLRDAGAICIVASAALRSRVPAVALPIVDIDEHASAPATPPIPARPAVPDSLCYVMYTSGTTGEPKGVAVSHAAVVNLLASMQRAPGLTPADTLLAVTPLTFDIAGLEILLPLITGARLVVAPRHTAADGVDLRDHLLRENVSVLQATPATWRLLLDTRWQAPPGFRVLCGGEPLLPELAGRLIAGAGHVWNCYGPTETTIWSMVDCLRRADAPITIGYPIANTRVYLLDRALEPVPIGVLADLHIAGTGLARGYLGRPAQTASAFRPDPFGGRAGSRMYAAGDLARYRSDGRIECRGRRDHQVKLHGRRIELDAIANVLDTHPDVRESVTSVRQDAARGAFLAAYVVAEPQRSIERGELRQYIGRRLPPYMIPVAVSVLEKLPRTAHGKVDRAALPAPAEADFPPARTLVAPRTGDEQTVAQAWCDVLGVAAVGLDDDFFDLGGSSLQATQVLSRLHASLGVDLSVQTFFEASTLEALAARVGRARERRDEPRYGAIVPAARSGALRLGPLQENWWASEHLTGSVNPNNTLFGLRITGRLHVPALDRAWLALQRRHESLRTIFTADQNGGATPCVVPAEACARHLCTIDLSHVRRDAREPLLQRIVQSDNGRPFRLDTAPLCRATLIRSSADDHLLVLTAPYIACDGGSVNALLEELCSAYTAVVAGAPAPHADLRLQYVDFVQWQHEWLASEGAARQLAYWRQRLAPPWPDLFPRSAAAGDVDTPFFSIRGVWPWTFQPAPLDAARRLARREKCTLFSTVLSALAVVLHACTDRADVRVGALAANRQIPGTDQVVGLFANPVCLRTQVDRTHSYRELMRQVHTTIGDATAHQELPFEIVARALADAYRIPRAALFQVMVFWGMAAPPLHLPSVEVTPYRLDDEESIVLARNLLDLRFAFIETPGGLIGSVTYRTNLFALAEIRSLVEALERCLTLAERDAGMRLERLCEALVDVAGFPRRGAAHARA